MAVFIQFPCPCGRTLRAREDQAGSAVKCWSCQAQVVVPRARNADRLARESLDSARRVLGAETFFMALFAAAVASGLLTIPRVGLALGFGFLAIGVTRYVDILRQSGLRGTPDPSATRLVTPLRRCLLWLGRLAACLLALALWLAPFLLRHGVMDRGHVLLGLAGPGLWALAFASILLVPLGIVCTTACDRHGALPARLALLSLGAHPVATAAALLIVPAGVVALEGATIATTMEQNWFNPTVADLFPMPGHETARFGKPPARLFDFVNTHTSEYFKIYESGLRRGYALASAIPASLPFGYHTQLSPFMINADHRIYLAVRVLFTALILTAMTSILAIQARWLGLIVSIDARPGVPAQPAPGL